MKPKLVSVLKIDTAPSQYLAETPFSEALGLLKVAGNSYHFIVHC